jgi:hypothetical protein
MRVLSAAAVLLLAACARREVVPPPAETPSQTVTGSGPAITLERTACFGSCPVYTISVTSSGDVKYEGKAHVHQMGPASGRIPKDQVAALLSEIEQAGYFTYDERYQSSEPGCGRYATDSPTVITSVTMAGRTKRITHDYGCSGAPGALTILERKIDDALGSGRWTGH